MSEQDYLDIPLVHFAEHSLFMRRIWKILNGLQSVTAPPKINLVDLFTRRSSQPPLSRSYRQHRFAQLSHTGADVVGNLGTNGIKQSRANKQGDRTWVPRYPSFTDNSVAA